MTESRILAGDRPKVELPHDVPAGVIRGLDLAAECTKNLQSFWHDFHQFGHRKAGLKAFVRQVFRAVFRRAMGPYFESQAILNGHLVASVTALEKAGQEADDQARLTADMSARLAALEGRADAADRGLVGARNRTEEVMTFLGREVGHLQGTLLPQMPAGVPYLAFEQHFRGPREVIMQRQRAYLPYFEDLGSILDIGCGRGEFLDLIREKGLTGQGLDLDPGMVEFSQNLGLDVVLADAATYLESLPDASLGGVFMGQVIEHLPAADFGRLMRLVYSKLMPGGTFVSETVNPMCQRALANFFIDPTHLRPIHPELAKFLAMFSGLEIVGLMFTSPLGGANPELISIHGQPDGVDVYMDYALIARRPLASGASSQK